MNKIYIFNTYTSNFKEKSNFNVTKFKKSKY